MTVRDPGTATPDAGVGPLPRRVALLAGPAAAAVLVAGTLLAFALTPSTASPETAFDELGLLLHASVVVGGLLGITFVRVVWNDADHLVQRLGVGLFGLALLLMVLVNLLGVAVADPPDAAGLLGVLGFMIGIPVAMLVAGVGDLVAGHRWRGLGSLVLGAAYFGGHPYGASAGTLTALLGLAWLVLLSTWLLMQYASLRE